MTTLAEQIAAKARTAELKTWDAPVPLRSANVKPAFPVEVLPAAARRIVLALAEDTQTPTDLAGMLVLAALSAACGGRVVVRVQGARADHVNLFVLIALPPGDRKSPVFRAILGPFEQLEQELFEEMAPEIEAARTRRELADAAAAKARKLAAKSPLDVELEQAAIEAAQRAAEVVVPAEPRLLVRDVTAEKLVQLLASQGGKLALFADEGGPLAALGGRYSDGRAKGGLTNGLDVYLHAADGGSIRSDRIGRAADHVPCATLTIGLAIQPMVLQSILGVQEFRDRGLMARFLMSMPDSLRGHRRTRSAAITQDVLDEWGAFVSSLVRSMRAEDGAEIALSAEALELLLNFEEELEPRLAEDGDLASIADFASKLGSRITKIAGLLHIAERFNQPGGWQHEISAETMEKALVVGRYLLQHAIVAFAAAGADPIVEAAEHALSLMVEKFAGKPVTTAELVTAASRSKLADVLIAEGALNLLVRHNLVRQATRTNRGTWRYAARPDAAEFLPKKRGDLQPPAHLELVPELGDDRDADDSPERPLDDDELDQVDWEAVDDWPSA